MDRRALAVLVSISVCAGCSGGAPSKSEREAATAALQKEAEGLKRDGETMNPALGVKATWTVTSVDVQDQAGNANQPFTGTIKFRISSKNAHDPTGVTEHNFERTFKYVYDAGLKVWLLKP
jgi:hypothetical protein